MGFIVPYASRLTIIISVLIVALREICLQLLDLLGLYREPTCSSGNGDADFSAAADADGFQYPYLAMELNSSSGASLSKLRASLVSLIYEGADECAQEVNLRCGGRRQQLIPGGSMECSVCLCELEQGQLVHITPNCSHVFHSDCIYKWLDQDQRTCPLCRTSLVTHLHLPASAS